MELIYQSFAQNVLDSVVFYIYTKVIPAKKIIITVVTRLIIKATLSISALVCDFINPQTWMLYSNRSFDGSIRREFECCVALNALFGSRVEGNLWETRG